MEAYIRRKSEIKNAQKNNHKYQLRKIHIIINRDKGMRR